ncbi:(d)CMP kinase [Microlunatus soli]|uniref:Cytidylate kinase n=1 Tax=Microlunatus soli TaxID=630515 RepID=A0A1H2A8A8_9ACTN|nr:(d)CMP kinase [Microlunatus soli]SDT41706.1 cytidylate kinase [Microlunatus soli]
MPDTDECFVVAVDGPSGSGKSSTSRGVAQRKGYAYLDTGAMYRAATWLVLDSAVDSSDPAAVAALVARTELRVGTDPAAPTVSVAGTDVTAAIREPRISAAVSTVATNLEVRRLLIDQQRQIIAAARPGIVVEGRDITTVVAPDAQVRVLLVADPQARVARRKNELGETVADHEVHDQVIRRDRDDSTVAEFHDAAPGVRVVDSTELSLDEVVDQIVGLIDDQADRSVSAGRAAGVGQSRT